MPIKERKRLVYRANRRNAHHKACKREPLVIERSTLFEISAVESAEPTENKGALRPNRAVRLCKANFDLYEAEKWSLYRTRGGPIGDDSPRQ
jgi:hypothetical protein